MSTSDGNDPSVAAFNARRVERARRHRARSRLRAEPADPAPAEVTCEAAPEPEAPVSDAATPARSRVPRRRSLTVGAFAAVTSMVLSGCGLSGGLYDVPLPGGADLGDNPLSMHVRMANVYDLVPQSSVKYRNVTVGKVTSINLANKRHGKWQADVTIEVNRKQADLPHNTLAQIRQTSLLGEKFVGLVKPKHPQGKLADNVRLAEDPGYNHVEVEQIFGALSLLLNNGGLPQVRTIAHEIGNTLGGHEADIKGLLANANKLVSKLNAHSHDIVAAIDNVHTLSGTLNKQKGRLTGAIDNLTPGLKTLRDQRTQLVSMLKAMQRLSGVTIDTIDKTRDDLIHDLKALQPTLRKLADSGDDVANSLPLLATMPFGDYSEKAFKGDYSNLYANVNLDLGKVVKNLGRSRQNFVGQTGALPPKLSGLLGGKPEQSGSPDSGTASGTYPNDPDYGKQGGQGKQGQSGPPQSGGDGGLGGIFGTLTGGGA